MVRYTHKDFTSWYHVENISNAMVDVYLYAYDLKDMGWTVQVKNNGKWESI